MRVVQVFWVALSGLILCAFRQYELLHFLIASHVNYSCVDLEM